MTTTTVDQRPTEPRLHTIGAVCERLRGEFPDVSISKIRYLEDQGLLRPRRTRGGYRLFSDGDVERLETILRLQRDEFLPLRVIRETLDAQGPPRVAIVNETLARQLLGERNSPGDRVIAGGNTYEVVGIVANYASSPMRGRRRGPTPSTTQRGYRKAAVADR